MDYEPKIFAVLLCEDDDGNSYGRVVSSVNANDDIQTVLDYPELEDDDFEIVSCKMPDSHVMWYDKSGNLDQFDLYTNPVAIIKRNDGTYRGNISHAIGITPSVDEFFTSQRDAENYIANVLEKRIVLIDGIRTYILQSE